MSTMVKTFCDECGKQCSDVSIYDLPYIKGTICWACADVADYIEYLEWEKAQNV